MNDYIDKQIKSMRYCAYCEFNDGNVYTSLPPMYRCTITDEYHFGTYECDCDIDTQAEKPDYINRQAAIGLVKDVCYAVMSGCESRYDTEVEDEVYMDILELDAILRCNKEVRAALRNMPSAEVEPVKKGYWINITGDEDSPRQCSACLQDFDYIDGLCYLVSGQHLPSYCPCCGAKMEGEEK